MVCLQVSLALLPKSKTFAAQHFLQDALDARILMASHKRCSLKQRSEMKYFRISSKVGWGMLGLTAALLAAFIMAKWTPFYEPFQLDQYSDAKHLTDGGRSLTEQDVKDMQLLKRKEGSVSTTAGKPLWSKAITKAVV